MMCLTKSVCPFVMFFDGLCNKGVNAKSKNMIEVILIGGGPSLIQLHANWWNVIMHDLQISKIQN